MTKRFRIGVISSVHGIHGECKVFVTSDSPERFKKLKTVRAVRPQDPLSGAKGGEETELELVSVRFFNNMAICRFRGIDTPEEIRKYRGMELWIDRSEAVPLEKDEFFSRAKRVEIPASVTGIPFYLKMGYDYKNGITEPDEEHIVRMEKFRN